MNLLQVGFPVRRLRAVLLPMLFALLPVAVQAQQEVTVDTRLAQVDGEVITLGAFAATLQRKGRETYWHSGVPQAERPTFERKVLNDMVDRILLLAECDRLGIEADLDRVEEQVEALDARYYGRDGWDEARDRVLEESRSRFAEDDRLATLEARVRAVPAPTDRAVRDYYAANPEKFTEPAKVRVSVVLLRVDPSAGNQAWVAGVERAQVLRGALSEGGDFAQIAREYSDDITAASGGDMGFQHAGTLGETIDAALESMAVGDVSEPLVLLEGVALIKLAERIAPEKHPYEAVAERARALLERDLRDAAWSGRIEALRAAAKIEIVDSLLTPESEPAAAN